MEQRLKYEKYKVHLRHIEIDPEILAHRWRMIFCIHDWVETADEWWEDQYHLTFKFCVKCGKWKGKVTDGHSPALKEKFSRRFYELAEDASKWM